MQTFSCYTYSGTLGGGMNLKVTFQRKCINKKNVTATPGKRWLRGFVGPLYCLVYQSFDAKELSYEKYVFLRPGKVMNGTTTQAAKYS